jgi:hypothetical protein
VTRRKKETFQFPPTGSILVFCSGEYARPDPEDGGWDVSVDYERIFPDANGAMKWIDRLIEGEGLTMDCFRLYELSHNIIEEYEELVPVKKWRIADSTPKGLI